MSESMSQARELAGLLLGKTKSAEGAKLRQGMVFTPDPVNGTCSIFLSGDQTFPIGGIKYLSAYSPEANDVVWILQNGPDLIILGSLSDPTQGSSATPTGSVQTFAGSAPPVGWILCDGQAISRATYANLFAVIGTTYGVGDGSTTFNVPNLKSRVPVGLNSSDASFDALGETGGAKTHTLSVAEMPTHGHQVPDHAHSIPLGHGGAVSTLGLRASVYQNSGSGVSTGTINSGPGNAGSTLNQGSGNAHNNMPPYIVMNYLIKA